MKDLNRWRGRGCQSGWNWCPAAASTCGHAQEGSSPPARSHTFGQLADAIDTAFARWDLAHMHMFTLAGATGITALEQWDGDAPDGSIDSRTTKLSKLAPGEQFAYVFDFGDDWAHLCTIGEQKIDPLDTVGITPATPTAYWGWGGLPDQYGRRWDADDGESPPPKQPARLLTDLPPILPWWGPHLAIRDWTFQGAAHLRSTRGERR